MPCLETNYTISFLDESPVKSEIQQVELVNLMFKLWIKSIQLKKSFYKMDRVGMMVTV